MLLENIDNLSLPELMDILVTDTLHLLQLMNQKSADGVTIRDMKIELQKVQAVIEQKKSNKLSIA